MTAETTTERRRLAAIENHICTECGQVYGPETAWMCPCFTGVEDTGPNTWAVSGSGRDGDDLATFTLLAGPGIPGVIGPR